MEQGLTIQEQKELQRKEHLTGLIAILTDKERLRELERSLTITKIVHNAIPIAEFRRAIGYRPVAQAIDIQLTKLVASLNLKWNLSDGQIKQIVEDLIDKYPNETIEDFILIFKKARLSEFKDEKGNSEIYRLDSAVIFGWVEKYLDEKYQVLESLLMKEKDNIYKPVEVAPSNVDWHKKWLDEIKNINVNNSGNVIDDDYVKKYGKEEPVKKSVSAGYAYFEVRGIKIMACSQTHAEELVQRMLELGELEEDV